MLYLGTHIVFANIENMQGAFNYLGDYRTPFKIYRDFLYMLLHHGSSRKMSKIVGCSSSSFAVDLVVLPLRKFVDIPSLIYELEYTRLCFFGFRVLLILHFILLESLTSAALISATSPACPKDSGKYRSPITPSDGEYIRGNPIVDLPKLAVQTYQNAERLC